MPSDTKKVRVFLSSPSDLATERQIINTVCENLSHDLGGIEGFVIELIRWETHTYSAIGDSPQDIINAQIGQDYDIFLGMLGRRFGTRTKKYESGTEEEFNLAVERKKNTGSPEIMFFFYGGSAELGEIDGAQLSKIQEFRRGLSDVGLLYFDFKDEFSLYILAHQQLHTVIRNVLKKPLKSDELVHDDTLTPAFDPLSEWQNLLLEDSEVNASVLMQEASDAIEILSREMSQLSKSTVALVKSLKEKRSALSQIAIVSQPQKATKAVDRVVKTLRHTNRRYLDIIPSLYTNLMAAMSHSQRSLSIFSARGELDQGTSDSIGVPLSGFRESLEVLVSGIGATEKKLTVDILPGTAFSVEIRKLRALMKDTKRVLEGGIREMKNIEATLSTR
ncbi:MAG: DUF4062 domain-containing protein [Defluviimonas sp.]|uniref:DUF4062 domain-containing protein n=1 Tax=Albidovulum sp. TaxID=1872424 RepID=UPI002A2EFF84|nr:DUF4062 domain-containing protein [Defluviimonas sp.]